MSSTIVGLIGFHFADNASIAFTIMKVIMSMRLARLACDATVSALYHNCSHILIGLSW